MPENLSKIRLILIKRIFERFYSLPCFMNTIPQYCQKCREKNDLGEPTCRRCGTRLMLVVFPQSLKYDTNYVPTYYEDHLLERVTALELRLSQITERLAATLDLMLRQTKSAHSDHVLLETLIESLNSLGAVEKDKLTKNWERRLLEEEIRDTAKTRLEKLINKILKAHKDVNAELFEHLFREGIKLLSENQEKQGLMTLERALILSPKNTPLLFFVAQNLFEADKFEQAKIYLEKARIISQRDHKIALLLAVIYADTGRIDDAKQLVKSNSRKKDSNFCFFYLRGMFAAYEENWGESLKAFKEILDIRNQPETQYLIACVYYQLGRNKMSLRHLRKAVKEDSGFADAWFMLNAVYEILNEKDKAREAIEAAWAAKEASAQCLEFLKGKKTESFQTALPFLRFKQSKNRLLTGGTSRLTKIFKEELSKILC